jgi:hypothetical protein
MILILIGELFPSKVSSASATVAVIGIRGSNRNCPVYVSRLNYPEMRFTTRPLYRARSISWSVKRSADVIRRVTLCSS